MNNHDMGEIHRALPELVQKIGSLKETILANLVMLGEISAPTFNEERRVSFLMQRFSECGLQSCSTDEIGNGVGIIPGADGTRNILIVAHTDTIFPDAVDHTISIQSDSVTGPGVADNSLGVAILASLPTVIEKLGITLQSNVILLGAVRGLGRGNLEGLKFFLANHAAPMQVGICVEGAQLGRLSHSSIGMLRAEIACSVPEEYDWTRFGTTSAIVTLNEVITRILEIPLPRRPQTHIFMGSIQGGTSYNTVAKNALLRFEIRSESESIVSQIAGQIEDIVSDVSSKSGADVALDIFARRDPGGIGFRHPLVRAARDILRELNIQPRSAPSTSELSAFIDRHIPAVTIGITTGEALNEPTETVIINPIPTGLAQLLGLILAIDRGCCDES